MGDNYFTRISDVLTDSFDVLSEQQGRSGWAIAEIEGLRGAADECFRAVYGAAKRVAEADDAIRRAQAGG